MSHLFAVTPPKDKIPINQPHERRPSMQYLVQMHLSSMARPMNPNEGIDFIEQFIFPTLELCKKLEEEQRILAGGPMSGAVALVLLVKAESARELDDLITTLPVWPRMETEVIPLTTFDDRIQSLHPLLEALKTQARGLGSDVSGTGGDA
jgi:muconolactone delta-isomerase